MSSQGNSYALVIMTNKDVYFITQNERNRLIEELMLAPERPFQRFKTKDAKSGASLDIFLKHVSSIVVGGERNV